MPKIDKDYSLYRTYVIFRTLGLRHLVVVDVHNHVVGIITRKDLMPFNMEERLETLLDQQTSADDDDKYSVNCDVPRKSTDSAEAIYVCDKVANSADSPASVLLPSLNRKLSAHRSTLDGLEEEDEADSVTSPAAAAADSDGVRNDNAPAVQVVVTAPSKGGKQDWV